MSNVWKDKATILMFEGIRPEFERHSSLNDTQNSYAWSADIRN